MGRGSGDPIGDLLDSIRGSQQGGSRMPQFPGQQQPSRGGNPLEDFFGEEEARSGGRSAYPGGQGGGIGIEDILGGILGGGMQGGGMEMPQQTPAPRQQPMPQGMPGGSILDIIGAILGGAGGPGGQGGMPMPQQRPAPRQQPMPGGGEIGIEDILGGILGGGQGGGMPMPQQRPQQQPMPGGPGGIGIEDILGGILGGGQGGGMPMPQQQPMPSGGGGIMDIIGAVLGGGMPGAAIGGNPLLAPIVNAIARKLGLPPALVSIGLSLLLAKLMSGAAQRSARGAAQEQAPRRTMPQGRPSNGGLDLDDILGQMRKGGVNRGALENSGVVDEIAQETGLNKGQAGDLAKEILDALGAEGSARPQPRQSGRDAHGGLKDLLNTW